MAVQLSNRIRIIFFLTQLLYMAFGATMFGIGIYSVVNLEQYGFFTQNTYTPGAAIFIGVGALKIAFGLLGILVLFVQKKPLMITFTVGVIVLMLFTFIAAIYGYLRIPGAYFISRNRLNEAFDDFSSFRSDIITVQDNLGCCGATLGEADFSNRNISNGAQNCTTFVRDNRRRDPNLVFPQGCHVYLTQEIQRYLYIVGAIGMGFATAELSGLLIAMQNFEGL